jgi:hypothetical protein
MGHRREKRERRERGEARVTSGIQGLWWAARISDMKKTSERYIGFPVAMLEGKSLEAQKGK